MRGYFRVANTIGERRTVRRLVQAADMLQEFTDLQTQSPESAGLAVQVAVAVLVNTQSLNAIEAERHRRAIERN